MKLNFALLRTRWHTAPMIAAGFLPLPIMLCARITPDMPWRGLPAAAIYMLAMWLCTIVPGRRRVLTGIVGAALIAAAGLYFLPWRQFPSLLIIPAVYAFLLAGSLKEGGGEIPFAYPCVAVGVHIVSQLLQLIDAQGGAEMEISVIYALRAAFLVFGFLTLYSLNRNSLHEAAAKGSPAPLTVRRRNLILTIAMGLVTLTIACLPAIIRFFTRLWDVFAAAVRRLWELLNALLGAEQSAGMGGGLGDMGGLIGEGGQTSLFWRILEKIIMAVAVIAMAALAVVIARIFWRKLRQLWAIAMERLRAFAQAASEDYHDEISDTREGGERTSLLRRIVRRRDPLKGIDETKLAPRERIRFYYLRAWLKRPDWEPGMTARENLSADAAGIYEKARYSRHEVSESEADAFGAKMNGK